MLVLAVAGLIIAASFPRRVMPILSPPLARSTSSDSFCLASNRPTVLIDCANHLDDLSRLYHLDFVVRYTEIVYTVSV